MVPRSPPHTSTCCQLSGGPAWNTRAISPNPYTVTARATSTTAKAMSTVPTWLTMTSSFTLRPMSRKISELATNAA